MILKRWNEYTAEEKETILMHYFTYYGKTFITLSELELYHDLCKTNPDLIFNYILFASKNGPTPLVYLIRKNIHIKALNEVNKCMDKIKSEHELEYEKLESEYIKIIISSYNEPKPSIPFTNEQVIEESKKLKL